MNKPGGDQTNRRDDAVEVLLAQATPRAVPPAEYERTVRAAVHDEWHAVTDARRSRRRMLQFAAAACVLLALFVTFDALREKPAVPVEVATVSKSFGSVYVGEEGTGLKPLASIANVLSGQTVVTDRDAGIGLDWFGGGSLRLDEDTIVEFLAPNSIYLRQGRVYFDSKAVGDDAVLGIETAHGSLSHLGTQYMAAVDTLTLVVSVREGAVRVSRRSGIERASAGQRLEFVGDARPSVSNIAATGAQWAWVETTAPTLDFSGRSTYEFLQWVGRETGYRIVFESAEAERLARTGKLIGTIPGLNPREELEVRMLGEDLDFAFDEAAGTLKIASIDSGS